MELLILLVEKRGDIATRQEIVDRLWGKDVFVDTDHGINTAIRKIRYALKDNPEQPRFIQTVTGKGYRFVADRNGTRPEAPQSAEGSLQPESSQPKEPPRLAALSEVEGAGAPERSGRVPVASNADAPTPAADAKAILPKSTKIGLIAATVLLAAFAVFIFRYARSHPQPSSGHVMLVVLPFENLSGDPAQEYFSDGLTEEMISQLGALSPDSMGVISRTTSMAYKHTKKSAWDIGQELGVDYVLESSLRRDGEQLRITVQLIRTSDQSHVWAHNYDRHISGSIALQEEVAREVANQIEVKLEPEAVARPRHEHPDPAANEAYLRGRYFWNQFTPDGYRQAIGYFQQAIERDPTFAEAYSGLSDSYRFLVITDSLRPSEATQEITEPAIKSVALDDRLAESHNSLAGALMHQYKWADCEKELKRALALNPSYSNMHRIYAALLVTELRHSEAWDQISEAMRTDPLSLPNNAEVVRTLYYARDYDGALVQARKALQLDPGYYRTHFWMGRVYGQKHMYKEAIAESGIVMKAAPDSNMALTEMAYSLAMGARQTEARQILNRLEQRSRSAFVPAYDLAVIHLALNENEEALKFLQQAYDEHDWALMVLACEPRLDSLRSSPEFRELTAKVGLHF